MRDRLYPTGYGTVVVTPLKTTKIFQQCRSIKDHTIRRQAQRAVAWWAWMRRESREYYEIIREALP